MVQSSDLFNGFNKLNVLIVGDVMIDRYLNGSVNRISPEAPVPVVHLKSSDNRLGGAANVALNVKALGATPYLCSIIGNDSNGVLFQDLLPENNILSKYLIKSNNRPTTVKTRILSNNQQLLRVDDETTTDISDAEAKQALDMIKDLLDNKEIHVILFQDYNKGFLSYKLIREVILEAIKRDIPTIVDPKYKNFWAYKHVTMYKPNLKEIRAQLSQDIQPTLESLKEAAHQIRNKLGNQYTLITLSEKGLFIDGDGESEIIPTVPRSIADVCGAGDTVVSVAALGLAMEIDIKATAHLSNLAGGQVCEKVGVVPVDKKQLIKEYEINIHNRVWLD
ncbi:MAG: bifunctional ADP-heptose synthase [Bacteroidota bacterium]